MTPDDRMFWATIVLVTLVFFTPVVIGLWRAFRNRKLKQAREIYNNLFDYTEDLEREADAILAEYEHMCRNFGVEGTARQFALPKRINYGVTVPTTRGRTASEPSSRTLKNASNASARSPWPS